MNSLRLGIVVLLVLLPLAAWGQARDEATVVRSQEVLAEIMAIPAGGIPRAMLADAQGVAIIPNVIKGSFVIGARHGRGVLIVRGENGAWNAPVFITLTGGNVGWQIGVQSTDVILVFKTQSSVAGILNGKFTLGADAAAAAGPVGRQASAATDARLQSEIYSYSRSRGLFAGVSLDGSVLQVDQLGTAIYYQPTVPGQPAVATPAATQLVEQVAAYAQAEEPAVMQAAPLQAVPQTMPQTSLAPLPLSTAPANVGEQIVLRGQLAQAAVELQELLDPQWQSFLALPAEVYGDGAQPTAQSVRESLVHFDQAAANPSYAQLAARAEFRTTHQLLRNYSAALETGGQLKLPPPPGN